MVKNHSKYLFLLRKGSLIIASLFLLTIPMTTFGLQGMNEITIDTFVIVFLNPLANILIIISTSNSKKKIINQISFYYVFLVYIAVIITSVAPLFFDQIKGDPKIPLILSIPSLVFILFNIYRRYIVYKRIPYIV